MRIVAAVVILGVFGLSSAAQARRHAPRRSYVPPPLVVGIVPAPFGDRYAYFSPPGPYQLSSPFHTLCGFTLDTECSQETSYGP